jgi:hypothetical protein
MKTTDNSMEKENQSRISSNGKKIKKMQNKEHLTMK